MDTVSIDRLDFYNPVYVGDLLKAQAAFNYVGRSSMEIGARVEAENFLTGGRHHTASAYLTYVALENDGKTKNVPPLYFQNEEEERRHREAEERRKIRLDERRREGKSQS